MSQHVGTQPGPGREALTCPKGGRLWQDPVSPAPGPASPRLPRPLSSSLASQLLQRPGGPQVQGEAQLAFPYQLLEQGGPLGLVERLSLGLLTREAPQENGAMEAGGEHWPSDPSAHRLQEVNILELEKSGKGGKSRGEALGSTIAGRVPCSLPLPGTQRNSISPNGALPSSLPVPSTQCTPPWEAFISHKLHSVVLWAGRLLAGEAPRTIRLPKTVRAPHLRLGSSLSSSGWKPFRKGLLREPQPLLLPDLSPRPNRCWH